MAAIANTYTTATAIGQREDLTDLISNISYTETPFLSSIGRVQAKGITHDWQLDSLRSPDGNAKPEGDDKTAFVAATPTVRETNQCQILSEEVIVSGTLDTVDKAGRRTELAYQMQKKMKELARDLELALIFESRAAGTRRMNGMQQFLDSTPVAVAPAQSGTNEVNAGGGTVVEADLDNVMENMWTVAGGHPDYRAIMSSTQKKAISALTGNTATSLNIDFKAKKLINTITVYESDFGMVLCVPHQMLGKAYTNVRGGAFDMSAVGADEIFVYRPELFKLATLRPTKVEPLAKTGDANKRMIVMEVTLESRNEAGCGRIYNMNA